MTILLLIHSAAIQYHSRGNHADHADIVVCLLQHLPALYTSPIVTSTIANLLLPLLSVCCVGDIA